MRKSCLLLLLFLLLPVFGFKVALAASNLEEGVSQLAEQISKNMQEKQKQKIAIIDFSDLNGNVTALGQFMAEELTTQLFIIAPGKFEVVERRQLLKLEEELALGQIGFIEEKGIKKMGQVLGVDAIVTGSMTDLGNTVKVNARLIAVESAKVFAVAATDIPKTGMVADLIAKQVERRGPVATQPGQTTTGKKDTVYTWSNEFLNVTVVSLKKTNNIVTMDVLYENISDETIQLKIFGYGGYGPPNQYTYLLDENGERLDYQEDSAKLTKERELFPKTKILSKLKFKTLGNTNGRKFTLINKLGLGIMNPAYDVIIHNIRY